jgi:chromosome segregation ATPase
MTEAEESQRSVQAEAATLKKKLEQELNAKIGELERRQKEREGLLEKTAGEIAAFKQKAEEAEKKAQALKTSLEEAQRSVHTETSAVKTKLEQELNAKIDGLGDRLRESEKLLDKRNAEIAAFKMKAEEAEKKAQGLKSQVEENQRDHHTEASVLKKKLDAKIGDLEKQLKDKENLLEKRTGEITAFKQKVEEAEKNARALKAKIEESQRDLHTEASVLKKRLDGKIDDLEERLKEKEGVIEKRSREIADLKLKSEEAEKRANALKAHAQEAQRGFQVEAATLKKKLEQDLNGKIGELEQRLKDRESLLEKRSGEMAAIKLEAEKQVQVLKTQIEETQKTAQTLMTKVAETQRGVQSQESTLKKKLEQEFQIKIGEIERRLKDNEALLEQRNGEIAVLKSKAEEAEKKAVALKNQGQKERPAPQVQDAKNKKSLELEIKEKTFDLKQLQEQINHKDGLLSLMAKRNAELADLKSRADHRVELLEAQLQESRPVLRTEDSAALQSYKPRDS